MELDADELLKSNKAKDEDEDEEELTAEDVVDEGKMLTSARNEDEETEENEEEIEEEDEEDEEDEDEEEDEEEIEKSEDEEESEEEEMEKKSLKKSISKKFNSKGEISEAMEVSDFLAAVVEATSESLGDMAIKLEKSLQNNYSTVSVLAKSFTSIVKSQKGILKQQESLGKLLKSISKKMDDLNERVEEIEQQPTMRKSIPNVNIVNRNFQKSLGEEQPLSKSQILQSLMSMYEQGDSGVTTSDIITFESGAPLRPELLAKVRSRVVS